MSKAIASTRNPSVVEVLQARVQQLEDRVDALLTLQNPVTLNGRPIARCSCNRLVTQTVVVDHPVHGTHLQGLCDECQPSGYVAFLASSCPPERQSIRLEPDEKTLSFVRRLNQHVSLRQ